MLTGDLVRVRTRKDALLPQFLAPDDEDALADAGWLCGLVQTSLGRGATRGELDGAVQEEAEIRPDHKVLRGLAKVLFDRAEFSAGGLEGPDGPLEPSALRDRVFRESARRGPLALGPDALGRSTALDVLAAIGEELGVTPDTLRDALYADRKEEQRIVACAVPEPPALIDRYNVALVQAALLKATRLSVTLTAPTAPRVRQLLRHAKFHQLIHQARRDGEQLRLDVDGPESVLKQSTRYGLKLASFFPAVLLQEAWAIEAEVRWSKGSPKRLALDASSGLRSHRVDTGAWVSREAQWFRERWEALGSAWALEEGAEPVDLGGRAVVMPDFTFRRAGRVAHLEIVGVWRRDYLARRVEWLQRYGPGNLVLAVSRKLVADGSSLDGLEVVPFGEVVPAKQVLEAVERVATAGR